MTDILVLGDSHLASLRPSLNDAAERSGFNVTFVAKGSAADANLGHIVCENSRCGSPIPAVRARIREATGQDEFAPSDYAAIVLVGLRLDLPYPLWESMAANSGRRAQFISSGCYRDALEGHIAHQSLAHPLSRELRKSSATPILVVPNPYLSELVGTRRIATAPGIEPPLRFGIEHITGPDARRHEWESAMRRMFDSLQAVVLFQPASTVANGFCTASRFQGRDFRHMNESYGAMIVSQILQALGTAV